MAIKATVQEKFAVIESDATIAAMTGATPPVKLV